MADPACRAHLAGPGLRSGNFVDAAKATPADEDSPLHASCLAMREAAGRLPHRVQNDGHVRTDVDDTDLFALVSAVGWIVEQAPPLGPPALVMDGSAVR